MRRWAGCLLLLRHPDLFQLWAGCTIFLTVWGLSSDSIADGIFSGEPGRSSETRLLLVTVKFLRPTNADTRVNGKR